MVSVADKLAGLLGKLSCVFNHERVFRQESIKNNVHCALSFIPFFFNCFVIRS